LKLPPLEESFGKTAKGGSFEMYISNVEYPSLARMAGTFDDMYGITVIEVELLDVRPGQKPTEMPAMEGLDYIPPPKPKRK